jgi:hypothetical protein
MSVQIGGIDAAVIAAVELPGAIGILQVQVMVPAGLDPTQPSTLVATVGAAQTQDGVVVWAGDPSSNGKVPSLKRRSGRNRRFRTAAPASVRLRSTR